MIAAGPHLSNSPFSNCPSPLTFSLLLGEYKEASQQQTVPSSPSLSPLFGRIRHDSVRALVGGTPRPSNRRSPAPAVVPEGGERVPSETSLHRQVLAGGHKRQRDVNSPSVNSPATPSPIATNSKRFCTHCSNVYHQEETTRSSVVVLSRAKHSNTRHSPKSQEQVVPCGHSDTTDSSQTKVYSRDLQSANKSGVKELDLFSGNDIFASCKEAS